MLKRMVVGGLSLTAAGLISIATWEGFKDEAYIPVEGDVPTIGFGSTEGVEKSRAFARCFSNIWTPKISHTWTAG